jgi:DNA damage-binding protein 1
MMLKVMIFRIAVTNDASTTPNFALHKIAEWNHNYFVSNLVSHNSTLMLGDAVGSVAFLKLEGTRLQTIARDYGSLWPVCLQRWSDKSIIGANVSEI